MLSGFLVMTGTTGFSAAAAENDPATTPAAPPPASCVNRDAPPPPVDTSEKPVPGQVAPAAMPVPAVPVGGVRMAECGDVLPAGAPPLPAGITAASWMLQDLDTGAVLAAKNPHARERPASLIKTLLALVVVTDLKPDQVIVPTQEDAGQECTCVGIAAGAHYTVDQLIHGLLMHSGNDVAHAFATTLGGVDVAVGKMNAMATRIGATDTRAATPSGLDGPGMSTSAYDLSLIFHYAMKQPEFANAVGTKHYEIPATDGKPAIPVLNDNKLLGVYPGFLGGKTGFTNDARHTYVGSAARNGKRLALVTMRGEQRPTLMVDQASKLLDYGFALEAANAPAVGLISYTPLTTPTPTQAPEVNAEVSHSAQAAAANISDEGAFGTTGWIITLAVALLILGGFLYTRRRKQADSPAE
ncbi:MAG: D-alanyl-D-alanine carboxypeptidase [Amycolatopsis sp.]|nr:D-alanyl-D-alanine carboxypeptidase [Amycolatopsis sp.]